MANQAIIAKKQEVVNEIADRVKEAASVVLFDYRGLTDAEIMQLRRKLREADASYKVYKNTLVRRAVEDLSINLDGFLEGPNAIVFGKDLLEPIKVISEFAKEQDKADIKVGIISGAPADLDTIKEYASIPSRDGLLTMLAGGMIQYVKELSIGLNMYAEQLEK
jgi:large subunit ribosomal protein L10